MVAGRAGSLEVVGSALGNVRFGSKADIVAPPTNVRFIPESGHRNSLGKCRFVPKRTSIADSRAVRTIPSVKQIARFLGFHINSAKIF